MPEPGRSQSSHTIKMVENGASGMDATTCILKRSYRASKGWMARTIKGLNKLVSDNRQDAILLDIWVSEARKRQLNYEEAL